jgi:hypothetical protein
MAKADFKEIEKGVYVLNAAVSRDIKKVTSEIFPKKKR